MKFLRRTAHIASMIALLATSIAILSAQSQPPAPSRGISKGGQPQKQPQSTQQATPADQRGSEQSPVVVKVLPTQKTQKETAEEQNDREERASEQRWTKGSVLVMALIGFLQLWVFGLQALRLKQTVIKMEEIATAQSTDMKCSIAAATRAAVATEIAANAAKASAEIARDTLHLSERADVLFVKLKLLDPRTNTISEEVHPWSLIVAVQKNFGRTTATNVRVRWRFFINGDPIPERPFLPPAVIGAGAELETRILPNIETLTGGRFNQVARGEVTFRGIGELVYMDAFGKEHHATFHGVFRQGEAGAGALAIEREERD